MRGPATTYMLTLLLRSVRYKTTTGGPVPLLFFSTTATESSPLQEILRSVGASALQRPPFTGHHTGDLPAYHCRNLSVYIAQPVEQQVSLAAGCGTGALALPQVW